jgi:GAF domain-containing protein
MDWKRYTIWGFQICFGIAAVMLPIVWRETLRKDRSQWAVVIVIVALYVGLQIWERAIAMRAARETERKAKAISNDRDFVERYANAVGDSVRAAYLAHGMNATELDDAKRTVLRAISSIVLGYHQSPDALDINANYMRAYEAGAVAPGVAAAVRFKHSFRAVDTFGHILNLELWAHERPGLVRPFALPVEADDQHRLLPGAPYAFAMDQVAVVNTRDIGSYFQEKGTRLDEEIRGLLQNYFSEQDFKSFVSIPMKHQGKKIGVLNVQSNVAPIFQPADQKLVIDLLSPLQQALTLLVEHTPRPVAQPA